MMRHHALALPLAACLLLAGCTFGGDAEESTDVVDRGDYAGGHGVALAIRNNGTDVFDFAIRVLGVGGSEPARLEGRLEPGHSVEKWFPLDDGRTYSARLNYTWNGRAGSVSSGTDEQVFTASACPELTKLRWTLRQDERVVGVAFEGDECIRGGE